MFFILSKVLQFIIDPFIWIIILLLVSLFAYDYNTKKRTFRLALIFALFFSNTFIFGEFVRLWEMPATPYNQLKTYEAGIVLGGMTKYDAALDRIQFRRGADRLLQAIELYKKGIIKVIVFTGGSGSMLHPEEKEGVFIERYLLTLGIPKKDFFIEGESKNTRENATLTKELIEKKKLQGDFLLITSAFHMRRSLACFKKVGIEASPYCTDRYGGPRKFELEHLFLPESAVLDSFRNFIHEVVGFIIYKIVGYA